ncbi:MAG: T9SS type A sorting domain-containing protein, partial [Candidatus Eisenbacteria bacterium]|nr:T9SS type A sorting domain-containing protein [Candidatus Eisenbacteria bacterium]
KLRIPSTLYALAVLAALLSVHASFAQEELPPVPEPAENPITEPKRILGKLLFWEEQLSSDNTMACGSCHRHQDGSVDPRVGQHPGADGVFGTEDDIFGSPGIRRQDAAGQPIFDDIFGFGVQSTPRASIGIVGNQWAPLIFWDGRAGSEFRDPQTGDVVIAAGGALENQAVTPILSDVEMAHENRTWDEVIAKLAAATPLALASDLPPDMEAALVGDPSYADLFADAFGTSEITAARIGMAIATYERTVVPDQTPWDLHTMTPAQSRGLITFLGNVCTTCHASPQFTNNSFRNIGLRDPDDDGGRFGVTHDPSDRGRFKVPSLRNVGLRDRLMHTGHITDVGDAIQFYRGIGHMHFTDNQDPLVLGGVNIPESAVADLRDFVENALTDPRAAAGTFPFDRPTLFSESVAGVPATSPESLLLACAPNPFRSRTTIRYANQTPGPVEVALYDASGALVRRVVSVARTAGEHAIEWDGLTNQGRRAPAGTYFARVATKEGAAAIRLIRVD